MGMKRDQAERILTPIWQAIHLAKDECHKLMEEALENDPCGLSGLYQDANEALAFLVQAERRFDPCWGLMQAFKPVHEPKAVTWPNAYPSDDAPGAAVVDLLRQRPALAARVHRRTDREAINLRGALARLRPVQKGA